MLACNHMLSLIVCIAKTHARTHTRTRCRAEMICRNKKQGCKLLKGASDQVRKVYKEHLVYGVMRVQIFTGNVGEKDTQEAEEYLLPAGARRGEHSVERRHRVGPACLASKKPDYGIKPTEFSWDAHTSKRTPTLDYCRMLAATCQKLCETALTFHSDLPIWSAEVENSRSDADQALVGGGGWGGVGWTWGYSAGVLVSEKNLRILATCCFGQRRGQREGPTLFFFFFCLIANNEGI